MEFGDALLHFAEVLANSVKAVNRFASLEKRMSVQVTALLEETLDIAGQLQTISRALGRMADESTIGATANPPKVTTRFLDRD